MGWLKTFSLVIRSNLTALAERFENPERVLHQLILDMEEELERVRAKVAGVFADEIQLGRQIGRARDEAILWDNLAAQAVQRGDESGARAALEQKLHCTRRVETLEVEHQKQAAETAKLHRAVRDLEHKIRQAHSRRTLLVARLARVESSRAVNDILKRAEGRAALSQFQRLEARVERAEALEEAHDRLENRDPGAEELARQLEAEDHRQRLQLEYDALKRRLTEE